MEALEAPSIRPEVALGGAASRSARDVFVTRRPIFDQASEVVAYELLFRSSDLTSLFASIDPTQASSRVIADSFLSIGIDEVAGGKPVFIDFTRDLLLEDYASLLPPDRTVIQLLPGLMADEAVLGMCRLLKHRGYRLAVDAEANGRLAALADFLMLDFGRVPADRRRAIGTAPRGDARLVARHIDTHHALNEALALGCNAYHGAFFARPDIVTGRDILGSQAHYLQLLREVGCSPMRYDNVERIIKQDLGLTYKFLRYCNAAVFGRVRRLESIRDGLVLIGEEGVCKWVSLVALAGMVQGKPEELVITSAVRARFCESLGLLSGWAERGLDLFTLGMFSLIDAVLDLPMESAAERIALAPEVTAALLGEHNLLGDALHVVVAYESGHWEQVSAAAERLGFSEALLVERYVDAVEWAREVF